MMDAPNLPSEDGPALALLNTVRPRGRGEDALASPAILPQWLAARGLVEALPATGPLASLPGRRILWDEVLRLRSDLERLLGASTAGAELPSSALYGLNRVLAASRTSWALLAGPTGAESVKREHGADPLAILVPIARDAVRLLTTVDPARIRQCASEDCGTWFVDTSKGGRRRWCSMARCGNRAKARRHRKRLSVGR